MAAIISYRTVAGEQLSNEVTPVLQRGGLIAVPTETFYGLGVDPFNETALSRLGAVKGRRADQPILVLVSSPREVALLAQHVPPAASILMEAFWPGPLTIVFPARPSVPTAVTAGTGRIGIRLSPCRPLRTLLELVGPLTGTSANRTGAPPAQTAREVQDALGEEVDLIIDAGPTPGGMPSTVVEVDRGLHIVREGAIAGKAIQAVLRAGGISLKPSQM
jgi:L-threonylcarbamoyladenylate synthase